MNPKTHVVFSRPLDFDAKWKAESVHESKNEANREAKRLAALLLETKVVTMFAYEARQYFTPNADLEWIKGSGVDNDGHNLTWWKNKIKKWKGEYSRPRAEILVRRWDRAGQNAGPETFSIDDLSAAKAAAKAWSASSGSAEVTARIEIPYENTHTIHIGEYRGTNPGFYVWTVDKNGAPVTRRGPWEKDYEAIGTAKVEARTSSQYDYVVTFGSDPEATDFEIVKAFKAWSGEVHYSTDLPRVGRRLKEYR